MLRPDRLAPALLAVLGVSEVLLGLWMVIAPRSFFDTLGAFGAYNEHYVRDAATFMLALGIVALLAVPRPSWWPAVLALGAAQFTLHAVNHVVDAGKADKLAAGVFDAVSLAGVALLLGWTFARLRRRPA
ncbi:MAG: hypothetical protein ABI950_00030 [Solirubrobacteraceae bacterium]